MSFTYFLSQWITHGHIGVEILMIIVDMLEGRFLDQINAGHIGDIPHATEIKHKQMKNKKINKKEILFKS